MRRSQQGIALILVLWMISLLAVIAGNFAYGMRSEAQIARNLVSLAQARALADAGVQRAWYELARPTSDTQRWQADGLIRDIAFTEGSVQVVIHDESGKIDVNFASDELLRGLFRRAGLDEGRGAGLVDAVVDWRDADRLRRLHGAEEGEYRAAGKSYAPTNAPFETIDEIQRVLGMTPELYRAILPAITVYSKSPGVNSALAPREVLLAMPGSSEPSVDQYLSLRANALVAGLPAPAYSGAAAFSAGPSTGVTYKVRSIATMRDGSTFVREAVARLSQNPRQPVVLLAWGEGERH